MRSEPERFDNAYSNLKSYIQELDEAEEARVAKKTYALDQKPHQAKVAKQIKAELDALIDKHQIKINTNQQLEFQ